MFDGSEMPLNGARIVSGKMVSSNNIPGRNPSIFNRAPCAVSHR